MYVHGMHMQVAVQASAFQDVYWLSEYIGKKKNRQ